MNLENQVSNMGSMTMCAADVTAMAETKPRQSSVPAWLSRFARRCLEVLISSAKSLIGRAKTMETRKKMRVCETVALGDRRFVALLQVEDQRFLIGGAANSISLLAQLGNTTSFSNVPGSNPDRSSK